MRLKMAERDKLKRLLMRGLKHDQRREAGLPRLFPARGAQAPAVALMQPAKAIFGAGGGQVVADGAGELQELVRDDDADGMHAAIRRIGFAAAVAGPAGQRIEGTGLQLPASSAERRLGKGCGSTCRSRWSPVH